MKNILLALAVVVMGIAACDTPQPTTGNNTDTTSVNNSGNMNNNSTTDTSGTPGRDSMQNP